MRKLDLDYKKHGLRLLNVSLIISIVIIIGYFIFNYLLFLVIVIGVSGLLQPSIQWVSKQFKLSQLTASILCILTGFILFISFISLIILYLFDLFSDLFSQFPVYFHTLIVALKEMIHTLFSDYLPTLDTFLSPLNFSITTYLMSVIDRFYQFISSASQTLVDQFIPIITDTIVQTIEVTSTTIIILVLIVLLCKDWQKYQQTIKKILPNKLTDKIRDVVHHFIWISWTYLKVELIVSGVTTIILMIGFFLFGVEKAFFLGIALGLIDLIPIIGVGLLLWPWILYTLLTGSYSLTIGLSSLYIIIVCLRQFLEPKLISKKIGVNSFFVISLGYICFLFFGFYSLIITPLALISIQTIKESQLDQFILSYIRYGHERLKIDDK